MRTPRTEFGDRTAQTPAQVGWKLRFGGSKLMGVWVGVAPNPHGQLETRRSRDSSRWAGIYKALPPLPAGVLETLPAWVLERTPAGVLERTPAPSSKVLEGTPFIESGLGLI